MRLFIGVWLSEDIQEAIMNYIERSRKEVLGWKWTNRQNLHFTLKFLGEVEVSERRLNELQAALKIAAVNSYPFTLQMGTIGFFPKRGIPRIMWLGVGAGESELIQLAGCVEKNCRAQGFEESDKPFQPHVTIARAKQEDNRIKNSVNSLGTSNDLPLSKLNCDHAMMVNGFSLIESYLHPSGAVYKTVEDYKFEKL